MQMFKEKEKALRELIRAYGQTIKDTYMCKIQLYCRAQCKVDTCGTHAPITAVRSLPIAFKT